MSTIPAVVDRMVVVPYSMDSLIPQNSLAGEVSVMGLHNLSLKSGHKQVEKSVREGDRASEFGGVGSTCKYFNIRADDLKITLYAPQVSSPFNSLSSVRGSKETEISWALIVPCEKRLSVTVGISLFVAGLKVST